MIAVSIIIPIYNSQDFLVECIHSVLSQSFTDFELILVDDGSKDRSLKICEEFKTIDRRVKVFSKENGGVGSARNLGLMKSQGSYIIFVDSDDLILENYVSDLVSESRSGHFVYQSSSRKNASSGQIKDFTSFEEDEVLSVDEFFVKYFVGKYGYVWGKIFNRGIIENAQIRFSENFHFGEDNLFVLNYLRFVDSVQLSKTRHYIYLETEDSLVKKKYDYKQELSLLTATHQRLLALYESRGIEKSSLPKELQYLLQRTIAALYDRSQVATCQELRRLFKEYRGAFETGYPAVSTGRTYLAHLAISFGNVYLLDQIFSKLILRP